MELETTLLRIAELLDDNGEKKWAESFHGFQRDYARDPSGTRPRILAVYAGMGSFNDLVVHGPDRLPKRQANRELAELRSKLFDLLHQ